jgi:hypothetical protein
MLDYEFYGMVTILLNKISSSHAIILHVSPTTKELFCICYKIQTQHCFKAGPCESCKTVFIPGTVVVTSTLSLGTNV